MKKTNPNFEIKKTSNTLKADRAIHRVTFNPNRASSAEVLKFAEIIAQDNDVYDLYKFYEDLSLTENERASMFREVIQSVDLWKIRCNAEDKKKSGVDNENKLNRLSEQILDSIVRFWRIMDSSQELFLMNFFSSSGLHLPVMF